MKKNYTRFCSLALALCMSVATWAIDKNVDGVYQIRSAQDLVDFADLVNGGETTANAYLTAAIDMTGLEFQPIGKGSYNPANIAYGYAGSFNGNFHAITGLNTMLFGTVNGATIDGVNIQGGEINGNRTYADHTGSIAGFVSSGTFTRCYSSATVNGGVGDVGGLFGKIGSSANETIVKNCMFAGKLNTTSTAACIAGSTSTNNVKVTLSDIFVDASKVTFSTTGARGLLFGWLHTCDIKASNVWVINAANLTTLVGGGDNDKIAIVTNNTTRVTAEDAASGEVAYRLNKSDVENPVWFQNLTGEVDAVPTLNPHHSVVYLNGHEHCNGDMYPGGVYSNTNSGVIKDEHNYQEGACTYCQKLDENYLTPDGDGFYPLSQVEHLCWFSQMVKSGHVNINGRLTAPIDMTDAAFEPIGKGKFGDCAKGYAGTFKGNLHAITGLKAMFFGVINGATIDGLNLQNGVVNGNSEFADRTGSIAGYVNSGTITRCYSNATVNGGVGDLGGLFGSIGSEGNSVVVENCMFAGNLNKEGSTSVGCITGSTGKTGVNVTLSNIFVDARNVTIGNGIYHGLLVGWLHQCTNNVSNIWVINGANLTNLVGGGETTNANVLNNTTRATAEKAATGEVAYRLNRDDVGNPVWFQNLTGEVDAVPTLDTTHGVVYLNGRKHCNGDAYQDGFFSNTNLGVIQDEHDFQQGACTYCHIVDVNYLTPDGEGFYPLSQVEHLCWFSHMVKSGYITIKGRLIAPIDLQNKGFEPIGTVDNPFKGQFKGNLQPITNLSTMFFGTVHGASIDGVNLQGGVLSGNSAFADYTGSIAGHVSSGVITRCYSSAIVNGGNEDVGGLFGKIGSLNNVVAVKNCMFAGNISSQKTAGCIAGSTGTNDLDITLSDIFVDASNVTISNGNNHGLLVGWLHVGNQKKLSNIWAIAGTSLTDLVGYNNDKNYVAAQTTIVTAEDAASGMVAYGLNNGNVADPVWFQNLGEDGDANPVLMSDHGLVNHIGAAGYATQFTPSTDVAIPAEVEAYAVTVEDSKITLNPITDKISKEDAVVLKGNEGYYSFAPTTGATKAASNDLKGAATDLTAAQMAEANTGCNKFYALSLNKENELNSVGFYYDNEDGSAFAIEAGKGYLALPASKAAGISGFRFSDGGTTGIETLKQQTFDGAIYNLQGQRVNANAKGIVIVNGKKVFNK